MLEVARKFKYSRLNSLLKKEFQQIMRDKQLVSLLIMPPVIQLILYGFALSPEVKDLRVEILDFSKTPVSREIIAGVTNNNVFNIAGYSNSTKELNDKVAQGKVDLGLTIPSETSRRFKSRASVPLQVVIDGVDANTAGIAQGYISLTLLEISRRMSQASSFVPIKTDITFLYNPGLIASWFFIPGVMALVVVIAGTLVSSISVIREKEDGTLEQLLMTPAKPMHILAAKIIPLLVLLMGSLLLSLSLALAIFNIPFRGSVITFVIVSILAVFVAISVGMSLATYSGNQRQAILTSFFINIPLIQLSGAIAPIESMPEFFRNISTFDPLRYYVSSLRAILLRGAGLEAIWFDFLALMIFSVALFTLSARNFRKQLR